VTPYVAPITWCISRRSPAAPLDTSAADARGYRHDGSLAAFVEAAFAGLAQERQIETCQ